MIYYRAKAEFHDYFTGNTTVPGELITRKQRDSMFRYLSDNCFERVRVKRTHTYWCFGVRFPYSDAGVEVINDALSL